MELRIKLMNDKTGETKDFKFKISETKKDLERLLETYTLQFPIQDFGKAVLSKNLTYDYKLRDWYIDLNLVRTTSTTDKSSTSIKHSLLSKESINTESLAQEHSRLRTRYKLMDYLTEEEIKRFRFLSELSSNSYIENYSEKYKQMEEELSSKIIQEHNQEFIDTIAWFLDNGWETID